MVKTRILAIESSCDETAAAVVCGRQILGESLFSQIGLHKEYGGVVPEIASRSHIEKIGGVVKSALNDADCTLDDISAVAVTYTPGLVGALLVGVSYAKALAFAKKLPLIGVNHICGHICANFIESDLEPPFVCLVASGGHSHIVLVKDYGEYELLGATRDDAAGEAFDKIARALGLPYPGGPELEKLAENGDENAFRFTAGFNGGDHFDCSFSGLKTAVINILHNASQKSQTVNKADLAASAQSYIIRTLCAKAVGAAKKFGINSLAVCGGVAANGKLRKAFEQKCGEEGLAFYCPPKRLCTDNAQMIGCAAYFEMQKGNFAGLDLNAIPTLAGF